MSGAVRSIDGHQVHGSVQNGLFYSDDGTLIVKPDGVVEHGYTDAQGYFHSQRTVGGQVLYGSDTVNGGWISDDGKTAIDPAVDGGRPQHGISTPDGLFLPGGTTHTLPGGTTLYGYKTGNDFYSSDGTTIVLSDGTVLHGSTDVNTGIFTPNNGAGVYLVSENGIIHGRPDPKDGAILLSDGTRYMTPQAWLVDLPALSDAIVTIRREKGNISDALDQIESKMGLDVDASWHGPAGDTFGPVREWYTNATLDLRDILDEIIRRMQKSYDNYYQAELQNLQNMTPTEDRAV